MDDFIVEMDWSDDLRSLQKICRQIFDITPSLVTNLPRSDYWKEVFETISKLNPKDRLGT